MCCCLCVCVCVCERCQFLGAKVVKTRGEDARILIGLPFCLENHFISQEALIGHFYLLIIYYSVYFSCIVHPTVKAHLIFAISEADSSWHSVTLLYFTVQIILHGMILRADKG